MLPRLILALALIPVTAWAEDAPILAEYYTDAGSLPPEYAWQTEVTIHTDGRLVLQRCTGYETEGPACKSRKAKVDPAALDAIRAAATASGLADSPAKPSEYPMVGGSVTGGVVYLDGAKIQLISDPEEADAPRVAGVLNAVRAAIPARLNRFLTD
jgi:hypothetical protein